MSKPLEGKLVIELTNYWAATTTGRFMRSMGARVIKVETPPIGDACRYYGRSMGMPITAEENPIHDIFNGGKECVALNLKEPENLQLMYNMLAKADVFLTNTRMGGLKRLGLDWETLHAKFPKLVMGHTTGYGNFGPLVTRPGIDAIAYFGANGLILDTRTDPNSPPIYPTGGMGDTTTGAALAAPAAAAQGATCNRCGTAIPPGAKFCPNCADAVIPNIALAKRYIPYVGIETTMTPDFLAAFREKKQCILDTGLDFINCAELHLNPNNIDNYAGEPMYISRHGYVSPIWSHQITLQLMEAADREGWPIVVHDCCNRTKFTRDLNLKAHEGGWFGASGYACEFPVLPYAAFLPTLEDESLAFLEEEPLPYGYNPGDIVL